MSLYDAAWAIREAMRACEEAMDMIVAGAIGDVLSETLQHAKELIDIAEVEMADVDQGRHQMLVAAGPKLRAKLQVLQQIVNSYAGPLR